MISNEECALNSLNLLLKFNGYKRNFKQGFNVDTMQGAERLRMCHNVLRHWLLIAQVWTQT
jgi:hypothetical protein